MVVTIGKDRGKRAASCGSFDKNRVVVEGVSIIKRHTKANPQRNIKGGVVEREAAAHASNVQRAPGVRQADADGRRPLTDDGKCGLRKCEGVVDK